MTAARQTLSRIARPFRRVPTKWRWIGGVLLVVLALAYAAAYLTDEPLRRYVERQVNNRLTGYHVTIQRLSVHPHNLSFDLENTTIIQDANPQKPIADLYRLNTTLHWGALLHGRVVADITFKRPTLHIDLSHIRAEEASKVPIKDEGWQHALEAVALDLKINRLEVSNGDVTYVDPTGPFKPLHLSRINLTAENIRNIHSRDRIYPSDVHLSAVVFDDGRLRLDGHADFLAEPYPGILASVDLERIALDYFKPVTNKVNLSVDKGILAASGTVEYAPTIKAVHLNKVQVEGPQIEYVHAPQTAAEESQRVHATASAVNKTGNAPDVQLQVDRLDIVKGSFGYLDRTANPPYRMTLTDASLSMRNVSNQRAQGPSDIRISGKFMGTGKTEAQATVRPATGSVGFDLKFKVEDTEMASMNDVVRAYGKFGVSGGQFSVFSELSVRDGKVSGYVKPLFRNIDVGEAQPEEPKSFGQKVREGVVAALAKVLKNRPRREIATIVTISGRVDQPQTNIWEAVGGLLKNAFIKAILPGFQGEEEKNRS